MTTDSYVKFTFEDDYSVPHSFEIRQPIFNYTSTIIMPIDYQKQDGAYYGSFDYGNGTEIYDNRQCTVDFILNYSDAATLMAYAAVDTSGRNRTWTMELYSGGSGFFPFGADKGDKGIFSVAVVPQNDPVTGASPFRWHRITCDIYNVGAYPSYSFPANDNEGSFTFGNVTNCRFPDVWFAPSYAMAASTVTLPGSGVEYRNQGRLADARETNFSLRAKNAKCCRLLQFLTTNRDQQFTILAPNGSYPFGLLNGDGTQDVHLLNGTIEIQHSQHNIFTINMQLVKR